MRRCGFNTGPAPVLRLVSKKPPQPTGAVIRRVLALREPMCYRPHTIRHGTDCMSSVPMASRGGLAPSAKCLICWILDPASGRVPGTEVPIRFQAAEACSLPTLCNGPVHRIVRLQSPNAGRRNQMSYPVFSKGNVP
jgi:hypothetical protein